MSSKNCKIFSIRRKSDFNLLRIYKWHFLFDLKVFVFIHNHELQHTVVLGKVCIGIALTDGLDFSSLVLVIFSYLIGVVIGQHILHHLQNIFFVLFWIHFSILNVKSWKFLLQPVIAPKGCLILLLVLSSGVKVLIRAHFLFLVT